METLKREVQSQDKLLTQRGKIDVRLSLRNARNPQKQIGYDVRDSIQEHYRPVLISRIFAICNCSGKSNQFVPIKVKVWASTPSHPSRMVRYPFIELSLIHQDPLYPHPQLPGAPSPLQI